MNSLCKSLKNDFGRKEFATEYAQLLMGANNQYLDLMDTKNQLVDTIQMLEANKYKEG